MADYSIASPELKKPLQRAGGARFTITSTNTKWFRSRRLKFVQHADYVLDFIRSKVLPVLIDNTAVVGFTKHSRQNKYGDYKFRAHPCYRSDAGAEGISFFARNNAKNARPKN